MGKRAVLWFTGHSKAGKTTLTRMLTEQLQDLGHRVVRLDSDTLPISIIKPQADTWEQRQEYKHENLVFLSSLLFQYETIVLIASVGRFQKWRDLLRQQVPNFMEIYLDCPLTTRLERDVDSKYEKNKEYFHFYEEPSEPEITIQTDQMTPEESIRFILQEMEKNQFI